MEIKEIVNLRKLKEDFYENDDLTCNDCPFRLCCNESRCIVERILGYNYDDFNAYSLLENGNLEEIKLGKCDWNLTW